MDGNRFDTAIRDLTTNASRRKLFGGLLGGVATTLAGVSVLEAEKGGNGKGKAKGHGKQKNKPKVSFCHKTGEGTYQFITVGGSQQKGHRKHGDVECTTNPCEGSTVPCTVSCTSTGQCVATI
jgi:hypothetical protein